MTDLPLIELAASEPPNADRALPKKLFIKTYGCQMNVYDSDRMADALAAEGYVAADGPEDADLVLLNTCHIREKASEKVFSELGRLNALRAERQASGGGEMLIGVAGCVAQAEGEEIVRRVPGVDLVVGPQSYHHLPELVAKARGRAPPSQFEPAKPRPPRRATGGSRPNSPLPKSLPPCHRRGARRPSPAASPRS